MTTTSADKDDAPTTPPPKDPKPSRDTDSTGTKGLPPWKPILK